MTKSLSLVAILCLLCSFAGLQAQTVSVSGWVKDSTSAKALDFATVYLVSTTTGKAVKNEFSDSKGRFVFEKVDTGHYDIAISSVGYLNAKKPLHITAGQSGTIDAGTFLMVTQNKALKEVTITGFKPIMEREEDKMIYNTESDASLAGQNATDALRKVPMVSVDGEGNVKLKGQSNFKILLNGKTTSLFAKDPKEALKAFPADLIKKIEVISTPSAKYEGEGVAGVINIITKKKITGYNGSVGFGYNTLNRFNSNANISYKSGNLGISGYLGYNKANYRKQYRDNTVKALDDNAPYATLINNQSGQSKWDYMYSNVELSYDFDSMNTVSLYGNYNGGHWRSIWDGTTQEKNKADEIQRSSQLHTDEQSAYPSYDFGADFIRKFKRNEAQELVLSFNQEFGSDDDNYLSNQYNSIPPNRLLKNNSNSYNKQTSAQADFTYPIAKQHKLETGFKGIFRNAASDYKSDRYNDSTQAYEPNPDNTNKFNYLQNVWGVYGVYVWSPKDYTVKAGSRIEHTGVDGTFETTSSTVRQDYYTWLPSLYIKRSLPHSRNLGLAYNKKLNRPGIWELNPFVNTTNPYYITKGNPNLGPEITHNLELSFDGTLGESNYNFSLTESYIDGQILSLRTFDETTGITTSTMDNIGRTWATTLNGYASYRFKKKFHGTINFDVSYFDIRNKQNPNHYNSGFGGSGYASFNYDPTDKLNMYIDGWYWMSNVDLQGRDGQNLGYSIGTSYKFLNKKLSLHFTAFNLFNNYFPNRSYFRDETFSTTSVFRQQNTSVMLTVRYNFGKLQENVSRKRGVSNDDQKSGSKRG
jgi:outer membrane receptor protein involved in Fe transport